MSVPSLSIPRSEVAGHMAGRTSDLTLAPLLSEKKSKSISVGEDQDQPTPLLPPPIREHPATPRQSHQLAEQSSQRSLQPSLSPQHSLQRKKRQHKKPSTLDAQSQGTQGSAGSKSVASPLGRQLSLLQAQPAVSRMMKE